jgi:hypothetical protein
MYETVAAVGAGTGFGLLSKIVFDWLKNGKKDPSPYCVQCRGSLDERHERMEVTLGRNTQLLIDTYGGVQRIEGKLGISKEG